MESEPNNVPVEDQYVFRHHVASQHQMGSRPEERLLQMGEKYKERQRRLQQLEQKRRKDEEDRAMIPERNSTRRSSATRLELPVEQRMHLYLENCILRRQERAKESEMEEFSLLKSPVINSKSRRIVANMSVAIWIIVENRKG